MRRLAAATCVVGALIAPARAIDQQSFEFVERGHYLATMGDCVACHTAPGGKPFAGGLPIETPFGTLVSPNLTPDINTGIGGWTDAQFLDALQNGIGRHGEHLYPALPYPYYHRVKREDALAIRAYLATLDAVDHAVQPNQLPFPFNIRASMLAWNWLNFDKTPLRDIPDQTPEWNRGRYIVEGLAHCGACHTPKTWLGGDVASQSLKGGALQGWFAPDITADPRTGIGAWSKEELVTYLKTGVTARSLASGPMAEEIVNSSSHFTPADLDAIATYLLSLKPASTVAVTPIAANDARMRAGQAIYKDNCAACHTDDGNGIDGLFPRLKNSSLVQQGDPQALVAIVLQGSRAVATSAAPTGPAMPSFAWRLGDEDVAAVLTYVRNSWGNAAGSVAASAVKDKRTADGPDPRKTGLFAKPGP